MWSGSRIESHTSAPKSVWFHQNCRVTYSCSTPYVGRIWWRIGRVIDRWWFESYHHSDNRFSNRATSLRYNFCTVHTTQIFQIFALTLFGVLKRHSRYELPFGGEKATVKFRMQSIAASNRQVWISTCEKLFSHSCLNLLQELSQANLYSTRKNWDNVQAFECCRRLTSLGIICHLSGVSLDSIGSTSQNKMIWFKLLSLSFIRYRDIILCQQSDKWNLPEIHRMISSHLQRSRCLIRD
jgi:hypothetical protein